MEDGSTPLAAACFHRFCLRSLLNLCSLRFIAESVVASGFASLFVSFLFVLALSKRVRVFVCQPCAFRILVVNAGRRPKSRQLHRGHSAVFGLFTRLSEHCSGLPAWPEIRLWEARGPGINFHRFVYTTCVPQLLLRHKADVHRTMNDGWTALYLACQAGHISFSFSLFLLPESM